MQVEDESNRAAPVADRRPSVAIVGGGLAGISAALEASERGARVVVFERRRRLGGRAGSIDFGTPPATVDAGRHAFLGGCRNLRRLNEKLGLDDAFDALDSIPFLSPPNAKRAGRAPRDGVEAPRYANLAPASWLPGKLRYLPALASFSASTFKERWNLLKTCAKLAAVRPAPSSSPSSSDANADFPSRFPETFAAWLREARASDAAISTFWRPFVLSATSELPETVAFDAVRSVLAATFFSGNADASTLYLPNRPLRDVYHTRTLAALRARGVDVRFLARVRRFETENGAIVGLWNDGESERFDRFVLAVDPFEANALLDASGLPESAATAQVSQYECGAITAVHLWLDRPPTDKLAVVLPGEPAQWLFRSSNPEPTAIPSATPDSPRAFYFQALISGSHRLLSEAEIAARGKDALVARVWRQLSANFGKSASDAKIVASRTSTVLDAVISPSPQFYRSRPAQKTAFPNLALAGDWTATGYPSTMEGAVLSGVKAIDALFG